MLRVGHECGFAVDLPSVDTIAGTSGAEVGQTAAVFDATQEQSGAIGQECGTGVEDAVDGIRPVLSGEDGVAGMTEQ
jgi:hypothetical protein